jgi:hypothetical protein
MNTELNLAVELLGLGGGNPVGYVFQINALIIELLHYYSCDFRPVLCSKEFYPR